MAREFKTGITLPQGTLDARALELSSASTLGSGDVDTANDLIPIYDASGTVIKKVAPANLGIGGSTLIQHSFQVVADTSGTATGGSGAVTYSDYGATVAAGTTAGSYAIVTCVKAITASMWTRSGTTGSVIVTMPSTFAQSQDGDLFFGAFASPSFYITGTGVTWTASHVGFSVEKRAGSYTAYATNGNGSTQTKTSFSFSASEFLHLSWVHEGAQIKFYKNGTLFATHTTNLPSSFGGCDGCAAASNRSDAEDIQAALHSLSVGVKLG